MRLFVPVFFLFQLISFSCVSQRQISKNACSLKPGRNGRFWELRNGNVGVVIPRLSALEDMKRGALAPIQSVIYPDGSYSDTSLNLLQVIRQPYRITQVVRKNDAESCVLEITYYFDKEKFQLRPGDTVRYPGGEAGKGYYRWKISLAKGARSALIEEETDYDVHYKFRIHDRLPDKARYRGWMAESKELGYEPDGTIYRSPLQRGEKMMDATVDLVYSGQKYYPKVKLWEVGGGEINTGRYWMFYNSRDSRQGYLLGIYQGKASRLLNALYGGVYLYTEAISGKPPTAEVVMSLERRGPDNSWAPRKRFEWGLFVSSKEDLLPADQPQPIGTEMNYTSGLATRIEDYAKRPAKISSSFFEGALFKSPQSIQELIAKVKSDESYYRYISTLDAGMKPVFDAWRNPAEAKKLIAEWLEYKQWLINNFKTGEGCFDINTRYWVGARRFQQTTLQISGLLSDKKNMVSDNEKEQLLQLIRMFARIVWDNDFVPFFDSAKTSVGTANMPLQFNNNGRHFFALLFSGDPEFSKRAAQIVQLKREEINGVIYTSGASVGTPHYIQPVMEPLLQTLLMIKRSGLADLFRQEAKLRKFCSFYTSLLTPPSVRFQGNRKLISFGDGSEESAVTFALLGEGFKGVDEALSNQMYHIYENGPRRSAQYGYVSLIIDISRDHPATLNLGSANYPGYVANLRNFANEKLETSVWLLTGDSLFDHRADDRGELAIYALGAPLSLSRSSFYTPHANGPYIRSLVLPVEEFPSWNQAEQPIRISGGYKWNKSSPGAFARFRFYSTASTRVYNEDESWNRQVTLWQYQPGQPVIIVRDLMNSPGEYISSMLFMSEGEVQTDAGRVAPLRKRHNNRDLTELPAASPEKKLRAGWSGFQFTGQEWPKKFHPAGGIDWKLWTWTQGAPAFTVSQWSNFWQNSVEQLEYRQTMGREYEETQQILRIKGKNEFFQVILPYLKGSDPYRNINASNRGMQVPYGDGNLNISDAYCEFKNQATRILTSLADEFVTADGISVRGCLVEMELTGRTLQIRWIPSSGNSLVELPFKGSLKSPVKGVTARTSGNKLILQLDAKQAGFVSTSMEPLTFTIERL